MTTEPVLVEVAIAAVTEIDRIVTDAFGPDTRT